MLPALFACLRQSEPDVWTWLLLVGGGVLGYVGVLPRATTVLVVCGISRDADLPLYRNRHGGHRRGEFVDSTVFDDAITAGAVVVPAILIVAALGRIACLRPR